MRHEIWTIIKVLKWTTQYFSSQGIEQARTDAEVLLAHALGCERIDLYIQFDKPLTKEELSRYREMIRKRVKGMPVQYITGIQEFWSLPLHITPDVLIPRPETECVVEQALSIAKSMMKGTTPLRILEIGTGSGAISLALAKELPTATIFASDIKKEALQLARENAMRTGTLKNVHFFASNLFEALKQDFEQPFHLIVSNPPYVDEKEFNTLPKEVKMFEPREALDGGKAGLVVINKILTYGPRYLKYGGYFIIEIGFDQGRQLIENLLTVDWADDVKILQDYSRLDRVLIVRKKQLIS